MLTSRLAAWDVHGQMRLLLFLVREKNVPKLELDYPKNEEEGVTFVAAVRKFLADLGGAK